MSLNKVEVEGALVRDPELRFLPSGLATAEFSLVLNDTKYDREKREQVATSTFVTCSIWGSAAEEFVERVVKGDRVYVMGKLSRRMIEKDDGSKTEKTRIEVLWWQPTMVRSRAKAAGASGDPWGQASHGIDTEPPF